MCWWMVIAAVIEHGAPIEAPDRVGQVRQLGIDETSRLAANPGPSDAVRDRAGKLTGRLLDRHGEVLPRRRPAGMAHPPRPELPTERHYVTTDLAASY
jgi:hypothetical protein